MSSRASNTHQFLKRFGFHTADAQHWVSTVGWKEKPKNMNRTTDYDPGGYRKDMFDIIDIVAVHPDFPVQFIQVCVRGKDKRDHLEKIRGIALAKPGLLRGLTHSSTLSIWEWGKRVRKITRKDGVEVKQRDVWFGEITVIKTGPTQDALEVVPGGSLWLDSGDEVLECLRPRKPTPKPERKRVFLFDWKP